MTVLLDLAGLPALEVVARRRPVALVQPGSSIPAAPCVAVSADLRGPDDPAQGGAGAEKVVGLTSGRFHLRAHRGDGRAWLELEREGRTTRHESRRHARSPESDTALGLSITGSLATCWTRSGGRWVARAILHLDDVGLDGPDVHDEGWLAGLAPSASPGLVPVAGTFGQVGLRDPRLVSNADATPYVLPDRPGTVLLTASSAGPGGFGSGHTSLWSLDTTTLALAHRGDLFFRRPDRTGVYGDHATHLLRDGDRWLVATSTWGDFDLRARARVSMTLAEVSGEVDLTRGTHVLDTVALPVPTPASVGTWDPHLVREGEEWLLAYVTATKFFSFHPALATGPSPTGLSLRAEAVGRTSCEGPTLVRTGEGWRVLASNGRDAVRDRDGRPASYPVLDLDLDEVGTLEAAYPTNLPWPTLVPTPMGPLLVGFDGTPAGGPLLGYGTHGDLVLQRPARTAASAS